MKMVMAVVPKKSGESVLNALVNAGYSATFIESRGGMLRQSQLSLFIAVNASEVPKILEIIKANCKLRSENAIGANKLRRYSEGQKPSSDLGGAITFVWSLDQVENS
ncbi:MAG: cyclic-di-AMP receptor [Anaerolineaceae bacterium]|nr:cyclic-di-AMP receptor [Anaerolineaceae bacterium]